MSIGLVGVLLAGLVGGQGVEFIGHRGESADAPENTLAAFRLAWERGVKAIELDVHLTRDGELIVSHDGDTKRTTGTPGAIKESTLEELRRLDAGRWKGPRWEGEKLPTLGEALATMPEGARCFIEVKVGPESVPALVKAVRASGKRPEQLVVISFNAATVAEAKRRLPELEAYLLASFKKDKETGTWTPGVDELIAKAKEIGADGLDLSYKGPDVAEYAPRVKAAGLGLYVWTVDDPDEARALIKAGVGGITSNRPSWLKAQLEAGSTPGGN
jgi:glycerophosphoryl diester phosphodiesterase